MGLFFGLSGSVPQIKMKSFLTVTSLGQLGAEWFIQQQKPGVGWCWKETNAKWYSKCALSPRSY